MERPHSPLATHIEIDSSDEDFVRTREERAEVSLPARLIQSFGGNHDAIPVLVVNVSATGLQLMTDKRFSPSLPPLLGTRFTIEFFLDAIEIRHVVVEVVRSEKRKGHNVFLGCKFIDLPTQARLALRAMVAAQLASARR